MNPYVTFTSSLLVAIITVGLAGRKFRNEEVAKLRLEKQGELSDMVKSWDLQIRAFLLGREELPIDLSRSGDSDLYMMCASVLDKCEISDGVRRLAVARMCRLLFGRQIYRLAQQLPFNKGSPPDDFFVLAFMYGAGDPHPNAPYRRAVELGELGRLFSAYRWANTGAGRSVHFSGITRVDYDADDLYKLLRDLRAPRWYHIFTYSVGLLRIRNRIQSFATRNLPGARK